MIHEKVFDPFERILALFILMNKGVKSFRITFDDFGSRSMAIKDAGADINLGFSLKQRVKALTMKEFSGSVAIEHESGIFTRNFKVENLLVTTSDVSTKPINGDLFGKKVSYEEALFTKTSFKKSAPVTMRAEQRPFYAYIIDSDDGNNMRILGPDYHFMEFLQKLGTAKIGDKEFEVFERTPESNVDFIIDDEVQEVDKLPENVDFSIYTKIRDIDTGIEKYYVLGQDELTTTGRYFSSVDNKIIQSLIALAELVKSGKFRNSLDSIFDGKVLTIEVRNGHLTDSMYTIYNTYCEENEVIKEIFKNVDFTEHGIYLRDESGKIGRLISNSSESCFAFSLAYYLICSYGGGIVCFYNALKALLKCGALYVAEDGVLTGKTASGQTFDLTYETPAGTRRMSFKRKTSKIIPSATNGIAILGIDRNGNKQENVPDHYVIALFKDGEGRIVFDPYTTNSMIGKDASIFASNKDFLFITFDVTSDDLSVASRKGIYA